MYPKVYHIIPVLALLALSGGCDNSVSPEDLDTHFHNYIIPPIAPRLNSIYIAKTKFHLLMEEHRDTTIRNVVVDQPWFTQSSAYFNGGRGSMDNVTLNDKQYAQNRSYDIISYDLSSGTFHTDNTPNHIRWMRNGVAHSYDFKANIGDVTISSPEFGARVSKAEALTITWPKADDDNIYCRVIVSGKPYSDAPAGTKFGYLESGIIGNTGSHTFPAGSLAGFNEDFATIEVVQGTYETATIGGETYSIAGYTQVFSDVRLTP